MGLLSQILGGLAGSALGDGRNDGRRGGGLSPVLIALLPVLLRMLSQRGGQVERGAGGGLGGGGLGGLGGLGGGGLGGLGDILGRLTQGGYGQQAASWVGTGANEPLPPQAIDEVFGADALHRIAQQAGISSDEARTGLSELLPDVVDHFTPGGAMPEGNKLSESVDDYLRRLS